MNIYSSDFKRAVFLDRDGTIIQHVHHLSDPKDVRLLPKAADGIVALRKAGFLCIVVTNQSVVGRGIISIPELDAIHEKMIDHLQEHGAQIDDIYYCPTPPISDDRALVEDYDRKPGPGMLIRAAQQHDIDLKQSWMVGDNLSDMFAGQNANCLGSILIPGPGTDQFDRCCSIASHVRPDMLAAARTILAEESI